MLEQAAPAGTPNEQKNPLSKWMNIAVISGAGLTAGAGGEFVR